MPQEANIAVPELISVRHQKLTECQEQRQFMQDYVKGNGPKINFYLPNCDENGLFEVTQCYAKTTICWCVEPTTGSVVNC